MYFVKISLISIILILFYSCENKNNYVFNLYGDKVGISTEIKKGDYKFIDSIERVKFINTKACLTSAEINEIRFIISENKNVIKEYQINYSYSYFIDSKIVDVFVTNTDIKYFIRKQDNQLIKPFDTNEFLWSK